MLLPEKFNFNKGYIECFYCNKILFPENFSEFDFLYKDKDKMFNCEYCDAYYELAFEEYLYIWFTSIRCLDFVIHIMHNNNSLDDLEEVTLGNNNTKKYLCNLPEEILNHLDFSCKIKLNNYLHKCLLLY